MNEELRQQQDFYQQQKMVEASNKLGKVAGETSGEAIGLLISGIFGILGWILKWLFQGIAFLVVALILSIKWIFRKILSLFRKKS
ncbi:MAG: hypothetical protein GY858_08790 [Candidatus Omnitrophica bacterium]|nr:hypothetical protein [Candidatus Omnitrophota bacterium]